LIDKVIVSFAMLHCIIYKSSFKGATTRLIYLRTNVSLFQLLTMVVTY